MTNSTLQTRTYKLYSTQWQSHHFDQYDLIKAAQNCIRDRFSNQPDITSAERARDYLQVLLGHYEHEVFYALWLNTRHQVIGHEELFRGTVDATSVYPREVVKAALANNAAAVIFAHNHPSGVTEPSASDIAITRKLKAALALIDMRVLDHLIVGSDITSMAELGLL